MLLFIDIVTIIVVLYVLANIIDYMFAIDKMNRLVNDHLDEDLVVPVVVLSVLHIIIQVSTFFISTAKLAAVVGIIGYTLGAMATLLFSLVSIAVVSSFIIESVRERVLKHRKK